MSLADMLGAPADPFGFVEDQAPGRGGVRRDRKGNALLLPRGSRFRVPYTPASSWSDFLDDQASLVRWEKRYLARGLGMREDLAALAGAETYTTGFGLDDVQANRASGRRLDEIIERALDAAKIHEKADYGTAVHALTEPGAVEGGATIPRRMQADIASFDRMLTEAGMRILGTELFTANDAVMGAGTLDHVVQYPGRDLALVLDKKVGKVHGRATQMQTWTYATGDLYDVDTDERTTHAERFGVEVDTDFALLANIVAGEGRTDLYLLDLRQGALDVRLAAARRDYLAAGDPRPRLLGRWEA